MAPRHCNLSPALTAPKNNDFSWHVLCKRPTPSEKSAPFSLPSLTSIKEQPRLQVPHPRESENHTPSVSVCLLIHRPTVADILYQSISTHFYLQICRLVFTMSAPMTQTRRHLSVLTASNLSHDLSTAIQASSQPKYQLSRDQRSTGQVQPPPPPPSPVGFSSSANGWSGRAR